MANGPSDPMILRTVSGVTALRALSSDDRRPARIFARAAILNAEWVMMTKLDLCFIAINTSPAFETGFGTLVAIYEDERTRMAYICKVE